MKHFIACWGRDVSTDRHVAMPLPLMGQVGLELYRK